MIRKVLSLSTLAFLVTSFAAAMPDDSNSGSPAAPSVGTANQKVSNEEIAALRAALANQQKQIDELRRTVEAQQKILDRPGAEAPLGIRPQQSLGEVASTTPIIPGGVGRSTLGSPVVPAPLPQPDKAPESAPLQLHLGNVTIMPVGFMDFTSAWRSTNTGSGIGSNFGSIPFLNTTTGRLSEFRFSAQNSRVGVRVDADFKGAHVLGYLESDFLGTPTSNNFAITNHANLMRLRLSCGEIRKDECELLGGQSWLMLTPGRSGISGLPGDIFFSQDIDVNYQAGLVWSRTPRMRLIYHPNSSWALGVAIEDPEASIGGSGGGGVVSLPTGTGATSIATLYGTQLNNGGTQISVPHVLPDIEGKIAYDYQKKFHFEMAGGFPEFKAYNINKLENYYATG